MNTFDRSIHDISAVYDDACRKAWQEKKIQGEQARTVMSILLERQKESLTLLDSAQTTAEVISLPKGNVNRARRMLSSDVVRMLLYALLLVLGVMSVFSRIMGVLTALLALALLAGAAYAMRFSGNEGAKPEAVCHAEIPEAAQTAYSAHMSQLLIRDTQDIMNLFSANTMSAERKTEEDMAEMYQTIYFAWCENHDLLQPVLDRQEQMLWSVGLEAVPFSEKTANCFEIEEADCDSQMISPAIRRKKDGSVVKRGSYIRRA